MKTVKHIWRYITSPRYRFYVDLQMSQDALDAHLNKMKESLALSQFPPMVQELMKEEGINGEYATKLFEARSGVIGNKSV